MKYLKRLRNKGILLSIAANVISILLLLDVIDIARADIINKVIALSVQIFVLNGIVTDHNTKEIE